MQSKFEHILAPEGRAFPFPTFFAAAVSAVGGVGVIAIFALARRLPRGSVPDSDAWLPPLANLLDPVLLALLGAVLVLWLLSLWIITRYEERLDVYAESRERNRAIVDNMLDAAIHIDAAGRVAGLNRAAERMFGYRSMEIRGQPISLLFAAQPRHWVEDQMDAYPDLGLPPGLIGLHRVDGRRRDGTSVPLALSVTEVHVGGYLVFTAVAREIDEAEPPLPELINTAAEAAS